MERKHFLAVQAIDLRPGEKICIDAKGEVFTCTVVGLEETTVVSDEDGDRYALKPERIVLLYDKKKDRIKETVDVEEITDVISKIFETPIGSGGGGEAQFHPLRGFEKRMSGKG